MASAQTNNPSRPEAEYEFPVAIEYTVDGVVHKCFEKDGKDWKIVGHIVVDYRAFFPWAMWADLQIGQITNLRQQSAVWKTIAESADRASKLSASAYLEEHTLRLSLERERRVTPWLLGSVAVAEMIAVVGLSIWGAAQ